MTETTTDEILDVLAFVECEGNTGFLCRATRDAMRLHELLRIIGPLDAVTEKRVENAMREAEKIASTEPKHQPMERNDDG